MPVGEGSISPPQTVTLVGAVDVRNVGEIRLSLHTAIDSGHGPLRVDVSGLELGDDAALGVLLGAHRRARRVGRSMIIVGATSALGTLPGVRRLGRVLRIEDATGPVGASQA